VIHRRPVLPPAPGNAGAGGGIRAHNTLSVEDKHVQVFYPFHPLHGVTLQIIRRPKRGDGAVSVIDATGRRLKIPVWMLLPDCGAIKITDRPHLNKQALLSLTSSVPTQLNPENHLCDNLPPSAVDQGKEAYRGATTTSGPEDPDRKGSRAARGNGTRPSDRSHGPHSDGGLSRRRRS
jgi:hypothetical protein